MRGRGVFYSLGGYGFWRRMEVKRVKNMLITCAATLLFLSCASVSTSYKDPVEEARTNKGQYASVVFYNDTNILLYPSSSGIGIEVIIDGMLVSKLKWDQRIEVYIKKGRHHLMLTHWDVFKFTDSYELNVTEDNYLITLYCRPVSTAYEIKQGVPRVESGKE
jgi:hypothetical protein